MHSLVPWTWGQKGMWEILDGIKLNSQTCENAQTKRRRWFVDLEPNLFIHLL